VSALREATTGATTASAFFSSAIGTPNLPIRVRAPADTINQCNSAGGKTWHAARKPHGRSGSDSALRWLLLVTRLLVHGLERQFETAAVAAAFVYWREAVEFFQDLVAELRNSSKALLSIPW